MSLSSAIVSDVLPTAAGDGRRRTTTRTRHELADAPVGSAVTVRGKELRHDATVADARLLFERSSVQVVPVLDGTRYVGCIVRDALGSGLDDGLLLGPLATDELPVARAGTGCAEALEQLDRSGGRRLVVVADASDEYVGLVCLRDDRVGLCVDAECHANPDDSPRG